MTTDFYLQHTLIITFSTYIVTSYVSIYEWTKFKYFFLLSSCFFGTS